MQTWFLYPWLLPFAWALQEINFSIKSFQTVQINNAQFMIVTLPIKTSILIRQE